MKRILLGAVILGSIACNALSTAQPRLQPFACASPTLLVAGMCLKPLPDTYVGYDCGGAVAVDTYSVPMRIVSVTRGYSFPVSNPFGNGKAECKTTQFDAAFDAATHPEWAGQTIQQFRHIYIEASECATSDYKLPCEMSGVRVCKGPIDPDGTGVPDSSNIATACGATGKFGCAPCDGGPDVVVLVMRWRP